EDAATAVPAIRASGHGRTHRLNDATRRSGEPVDRPRDPEHDRGAIGGDGGVVLTGVVEGRPVGPAQEGRYARDRVERVDVLVAGSAVAVGVARVPCRLAVEDDVTAVRRDRLRPGLDLHEVVLAPTG